jgi:hypothetical protein
MTKEEVGRIITDIHGLNKRGNPNVTAFAKQHGIGESGLRYAVGGRERYGISRPLQALLREAHRAWRLEQMLAKYGLVIK